MIYDIYYNIKIKKATKIILMIYYQAILYSLIKINKKWNPHEWTTKEMS